MSIEGIHPIESGNSPEKREKTLLELKNEMLSALVLFSCTMDDFACHQKWLDDNEENFHFAFDNVQGRYGDMFHLWETDRDAVLNQLQGELMDLEGKGDSRQAA